MHLLKKKNNNFEHRRGDQWGEDTGVRISWGIIHRR